MRRGARGARRRAATDARARVGRGAPRDHRAAPRRAQAGPGAHRLLSAVHCVLNDAVVSDRPAPPPDARHTGQRPLTERWVRCRMQGGDQRPLRESGSAG